MLLGTPLLASSVELIPAALTSLQVFLLKAEDGEGHECSWRTGISEWLSKGLSSGTQGLSPAHSGVSPCLRSPPIHLCPGTVVSRAGTGSGPWGFLKGTFWWQILGKLQVTERKW